MTCLAAPGMRHTHDDLAGSDDLARLRQSLDDDSVRIGEQDRVAVSLRATSAARFGSIELSSCASAAALLCRRPLLKRSWRDEPPISHLVIRSLARRAPWRRNGLLVRAPGEPQVRRIDTHERLAAPDGLPGIDQTSQNLPRDAESEVALHVGRDDSGE
jgi:hypothetical protein